MPEVTEVVLRLPSWAVTLPSPSSAAMNQEDARDIFRQLLIQVTSVLRVIWIQTRGQHTLPELDGAPPVEGYELCTDVLLLDKLFEFNQLKSVLSDLDGSSLLDSIYNLFAAIRDFFNGWITNPVGAAVGTLDGILEGLGVYYLADTVLHWLHNYPYVTGSLDESNVRIEWASRAGVFAEVTEWGSQRAQAADICWNAIEQLGGEDVRASEAFQDTRNVAEPVTSIVSFFQGVRGIYNLIRGAGGAVSGAANISGNFPPSIVSAGGGAAAFAPQLARLAVLVDEVPWASAADVINAVHISILAFRSGDDSTGGSSEENPSNASRSPNSPYDDLHDDSRLTDEERQIIEQNRAQLEQDHIPNWHQASYDSAGESMADHYIRHGRSGSFSGPMNYFNSAREVLRQIRTNSLRGWRSRVLENGNMRFWQGNRYIIVTQRSGDIPQMLVTYGVNQ